MKPIPTHARAVIIGGGVSGCSVAYHLAKLGWTDIVLLERKQLTCGTTWHAAGLIGQLRNTHNATQLAKYSAGLYVDLEAETGVATGMRQNGSISVALTEHRHEELLRQATLARALDVEVAEISPAEVKAMYPHLNVSDVVGAVHLPLDGQCDPANIAMALAKGARQRGARDAERGFQKGLDGVFVRVRQHGGDFVRALEPKQGLRGHRSAGGERQAQTHVVHVVVGVLQRQKLEESRRQAELDDKGAERPGVRLERAAKQLQRVQRDGVLVVQQRGHLREKLALQQVQ